MSNYLAYIDESGDPIFAAGASRTLVLCAIVFEREGLPLLSEALVRIKASYNMHELKSSRVSSFDRRYDICQQLVSSTPKIITIRVDKDALFGDWFRYRATFYKYVQRLLNHELYSLFGSVSVTMDRYGSPQYQRSLKEYLASKLQMELFDPDLIVASAKEIDFIQASDFLAGTVRKALEGDFTEPNQLLDLIKPFWVRRLQLPDTGSHVRVIPDCGSGVVLDACMDEARRYLDKNSTKLNDPKIRTLEYLYYSAIDGSNDYIFTQEILEWLKTLGLRLGEEQFRNEVMAALRDDGLIIVGSRRGIKIPRIPEDIREYIRFNVSLALPVLRRLKKALEFVAVRTELTDINALLSEEMQAILKEVNA
ncbi:MAG: DUF3800 domain-containing protein [Syntrophaceae bacterium]|nr:DUF3800 domain-containing protein [Syntrophaceae bacterium]